MHPTSRPKVQAAKDRQRHDGRNGGKTTVNPNPSGRRKGLRRNCGKVTDTSEPTAIMPTA
ncbi:hypothetical protein PGT21_016863 [Puccinia graminis f. sp. tritici]|uniref:Uncharacterized protein n=1 Tax=Puccinia graminis f. sp. tritici TaxID=56615 RepID=A0A5B0M4P6_PUCGR|nr:hypothetical protein PGTUg99_007697 [Puccinia graminis f. sp. tritici]KAA1073044.1 hypothetical protein PGTUg99_023078 [Puccinia graminis f. sp. tritici]KAA1084752.1 hypothetical protein PGT21_035074 [Puccinia graminis f. sp. tritici]KAA1094397.1 hypothetical protein PGT21_020188 [Puccinia graminis f. sp. tritici]KAA1096438.1 hypothetical protein PGT21_016863 [Puccinia graminis f. sp. tritici]